MTTKKIKSSPRALYTLAVLSVAQTLSIADRYLVAVAAKPINKWHQWKMTA